MYDVNSKHADDFINHEEILETLAYADENKNNMKLIDAIIEKAKKRKGLTHREASVLLACSDEEKTKRSISLQNRSKRFLRKQNRNVCSSLSVKLLCQRLYLLPVPRENKHIMRKQLSQEEIRREVIALQDMGHKRLALEAGEDPVRNTMDYYLESIKTIYSIKHKTARSAVSILILRLRQSIITACSKKPASERTSCFRKHTIKKAILNCIRPDQNTTTTITPKRWTAPWKAA